MTRKAPRLPILETARLRLRPMVAADADPLFPLMNDPEVVAHWRWPMIDGAERVAEFVEGQVAEMARGRALHWTIRDLADDELLGCCDIVPADRRRRRAEVGFILGPRAWRRGYALEALRAVVAHVAADKVRRLSARAQLGDGRSEQLLQYLGFAPDGLLRGQVLRDGARRDWRLFGLTL